MKEAFDVMAEHYWITIWLGIVIIGALHRTTYINRKYYYYTDKSPNTNSNNN